MAQTRKSNIDFDLAEEVEISSPEIKIAYLIGPMGRGHVTALFRAEDGWKHTILAGGVLRVECSQAPYAGRVYWLPPTRWEADG